MATNQTSDEKGRIPNMFKGMFVFSVCCFLNFIALPVDGSVFSLFISQRHEIIHACTWNVEVSIDFNWFQLILVWNIN